MRKSLAKPRTGTVAILDIGSTKICCLIARIGENGVRADHNDDQAPSLPGIRVIGIGHQVDLASVDKGTTEKTHQNRANRYLIHGVGTH